MYTCSYSMFPVCHMCCAQGHNGPWIQPMGMATKQNIGSLFMWHVTSEGGTRERATTEQSVDTNLGRTCIKRVGIRK